MLLGTPRALQYNITFNFFFPVSFFFHPESCTLSVFVVSRNLSNVNRRRIPFYGLLSNNITFDESRKTHGIPISVTANVPFSVLFAKSLKTGSSAVGRPCDDFLHFGTKKKKKFNKNGKRKQL